MKEGQEGKKRKREDERHLQFLVEQLFEGVEERGREGGKGGEGGKKRRRGSPFLVDQEGGRKRGKRRGREGSKDISFLVCLIVPRITDAFNTARDRVHYLDMLSPHLEALEASSSSPHTLTSSILPALTTTVKRNEGQSRVYARSGYLGILFTKVYKLYVCLHVCSSYTV